MRQFFCCSSPACGALEPSDRDHPVGEAKVRRTFAPPIQDQKLVPYENGLGDYAPESPWLNQTDDCDDQVKQKNQEIAHLGNQVHQTADFTSNLEFARHRYHSGSGRLRRSQTITSKSSHLMPSYPQMKSPTRKFLLRFRFKNSPDAVMSVFGIAVCKQPRTRQLLNLLPRFVDSVPSLSCLAPLFGVCKSVSSKTILPSPVPSRLDYRVRNA
jgi:hypothetical protein